jgi:hypothetical protein
LPGLFSVEQIDPSKISEFDKNLIDRIAQRVVEMGMSVPAVIFLEMTKPLSFVGSQVMVFFGPFVQAFFTIKDYYRFTEMVEDRINIEYLMQRIEFFEDQKKEKILDAKSHPRYSTAEKRGIIYRFKERFKRKE